MNDFIKEAYDIGVQAALEEMGLMEKDANRRMLSKFLKNMEANPTRHAGLDEAQKLLTTPGVSSSARLQSFDELARANNMENLRNPINKYLPRSFGTNSSVAIQSDKVKADLPAAKRELRKSLSVYDGAQRTNISDTLNDNYENLYRKTQRSNVLDRWINAQKRHLDGPVGQLPG